MTSFRAQYTCAVKKCYLNGLSQKISSESVMSLKTELYVQL